MVKSKAKKLAENVYPAGCPSRPAGMDDGADIGPSGALTWASIVGASIIIGLVILWILSHNF